MFDLHYDLLTRVLKDKDKIDLMKDYYTKVFNKKNIIGGIFNLFYMSYSEMEQELGLDKEEINLIQNLKYVKKFIDIDKIIPNGTKYMFGIEGLDYLEKIEDIDELYDLGVRCVNPVWNNENKFGGGVRANENVGLTKLGEELIEKLVDKKIAIDLSHANEKTFWDIINLCRILKRQGKTPIIFASHSNVKSLCNIPRNLTDEQIMAIKKLDGVIGVVSIKKFCIDTDDICNPNIDFEQGYIEHINYLKHLLGTIDNIAVSTDDMSYYTVDEEYYKNINVFSHHNVKKRIVKLLKRRGYETKKINKILYENFSEKILSKM